VTDTTDKPCDCGCGRTPPERLWLQDACAGEAATWCAERIHDEDVEYIRADLAQSALAAAVAEEREKIAVLCCPMCQRGIPLRYAEATDPVHRWWHHKPDSVGSVACLSARIRSMGDTPTPPGGGR